MTTLTINVSDAGRFDGCVVVDGVIRARAVGGDAPQVRVFGAAGLFADVLRVLMGQQWLPATPPVAMANGEETEGRAAA